MSLSESDFELRDGKYHCTDSTCKFSSKTALRCLFHCLQKHEDQQKPQCPEKGCDKAFSTLTGFLSHVEGEHRGKLYACPIPGCTTTSKYLRGDIISHKRGTHKIVLPMEKRGKTNRGDWYRQCKRVHCEWCQSKGYPTDGVSFFDSPYERSVNDTEDGKKPDALNDGQDTEANEGDKEDVNCEAERLFRLFDETEITDDESDADENSANFLAQIAEPFLNSPGDISLQAIADSLPTIRFTHTSQSTSPQMLTD